MFILLKGKGGQEAGVRLTGVAQGRVVDRPAPGQVNAPRKQETRQTPRSLIPGAKSMKLERKRRGLPPRVLLLTWFREPGLTIAEQMLRVSECLRVPLRGRLRTEVQEESF